MKRNTFLILFFFLALPQLALSFTERELSEFIVRKTDGYKFVKTVFFDRNFICSENLEADDTLENVARKLLRCGYRIRFRKTEDNSLEVFVFRFGKVEKSPRTIILTDSDFDLLSFLRTFFSDFEVEADNVDLRQIELPSGIKEVSLQSLSGLVDRACQERCQMSILISLKKIIISPKVVRRLSKKTLYGLFLPFDSLSRDLYELVKGYFSQTKIVRFKRDGKIYLLLSKPALSREDCVKVFAYLRAIVDDKWQKSQKLGEFFPRNERKNLELLYQLLAQTSIRAFLEDEIEGVGTEWLRPQPTLSDFYQTLSKDAIPAEKTESRVQEEGSEYQEDEEIPPELKKSSSDSSQE